MVSVPDAPPATGRAGRDLRAAIAVGVALGVVILGTLFTVRIVWVVFVCVAVGTGAFEVVRAVRLLGRRVPMVPLVAGAAASPLVAYLQGTDGMIVTFGIVVLVVSGWRLAGPADGVLEDVALGVFVAVYPGLLAGFAGLLTSGPDGPRRVVTFIAVVAFSDIGGYAAGVLSGGRHKLAPTISPGKSWEGFAGSACSCMALGAIFFPVLLHAGAASGVLYGLAVVVCATLGDLGESVLKRDIGIKDMGTLLPGHGGIMDRLDSLLCTAPVAWLLISALVPPR